MEPVIFGDEAVPQMLLLLSQAARDIGALDLSSPPARNKNPVSTPSKSRYHRALLREAPRSSNNALEARLLQGACSVSLSSRAAQPEREMDPSPSARSNSNFEKYRVSGQARILMNNLTVLERAAIGAAAGGIAGAFTYACLHPLDTIKTRLQTRGAAEAYKGSIDAAVKILQSKGLAGFYSGISAVIVGSMVSSAIYFGTCEFGKSFLSKVAKFPPLLVPPVAGAMGNIVSSAILVPKEVITQRMQAGAKGRSWNVLMRTLERDGLKGLYVGYSAALLRNLPSGVINFSTFEYLRVAWLRVSGQDSLEPWQSVSSGALAGAIAAALTTPMDVVKTRLMTQSRERAAAFTYEGVTRTLERIWIEEGWAGVTRGMGPRLLHSACFSAIGFFAFETARFEILKRHVANKQAEMLEVEVDEKK
ncbi:protein MITOFERRINLIKE 1, chloroplastic [Selaginella moellendorffii]|nr:protein MITOFERRINLIKE 1, chloroplastic [Selaginella moellendorffii]|eukprot:XP_002970352.2 protein MITOFERRINLIKE 1, chloroplastic [Selaginella moellendorffii]